MGAKPADAGIVTSLHCSVRLYVRSNDEALDEVPCLCVFAGLIKPRENDDDGLAIDNAGAIVNNQAVGVHGGSPFK
jgi:hypothetical protein